MTDELPITPFAVHIAPFDPHPPYCAVTTCMRSGTIIMWDAPHMHGILVCAWHHEMAMRQPRLFLKWFVA